MISLPVLVLLLIVPVALIDYFAFRERFKKEYGEPMRWYYFVVPCALELGCFAAGYIMGAAP
jgi:hypothetical protein